MNLKKIKEKDILKILCNIIYKYIISNISVYDNVYTKRFKTYILRNITPI